MSAYMLLYLQLKIYFFLLTVKIVSINFSKELWQTVAVSHQDIQMRIFKTYNNLLLFSSSSHFQPNLH